MAVSKRRQFSAEKGICHMSDDTIAKLPGPSGNSPDPLTDVIRSGARKLIEQAIEAELATLLAAFADHGRASSEDGAKSCEAGPSWLSRTFHTEREVVDGATRRSCGSWPRAWPVRGMPGLALMVQEALGRDPHAGDLFVFRGKQGSLLKILWHDGVGMSLYARRLEKGRFIWPTPKNGSVAISAAQLAYMLDGIDWRNPRQTWRPQTAG
jgi:transposase